MAPKIKVRGNGMSGLLDYCVDAASIPGAVGPERPLDLKKKIYNMLAVEANKDGYKPGAGQDVVEELPGKFVNEEGAEENSQHVFCLECEKKKLASQNKKALQKFANELRLVVAQLTYGAISKDEMVLSDLGWISMSPDPTQPEDAMISVEDPKGGPPITAVNFLYVKFNDGTFKEFWKVDLRRLTSEKGPEYAAEVFDEKFDIMKRARKFLQEPDVQKHIEAFSEKLAGVLERQQGYTQEQEQKAEAERKRKELDERYREISKDQPRFPGGGGHQRRIIPSDWNWPGD